MKFYSERLNKLFDTEDELIAAEEVYKAQATKANEIKLSIKQHLENISKELENMYEDCLELEKNISDDELAEFAMDLIPKLMKTLIKFEF